MTSDAPEEPEATTGASEGANGERERPVSEDSEESKATMPSSSESSGERSDPRDGEGSEEPEATTGASEDASGEPEATTEPAEFTSGEEGTDAPREIEDSKGSTDGSQRDGSESDEIPLSIAGHEDREPPDGAAANSFAEEGDESTEALSDSISENGESDEEDVQPVELLVQLAKDGEIDPWDIDIVHVTDTFLDALDEADLRTSGRALFYASVLLRMKSDVLFNPDEPAEEDELPPWEAAFVDEDGRPDEDGPVGFDPVERLEAEMDRRLERQHARGKPETLDELVRELRDAERGSWWKRSREYDTSNSPSGFNRGVQELSYHSEDAYRGVDEPTADDVTHTQHDEDIEDVIADVEAALEPHYEGGREEVLFAEIEEAGGSRVMTYLALLFLSHRGQIRLEQDELFGDLWIQRVTVEAEPSEAIAD